ncbi:MAG TPA: hypothetical protein VFZ65_15280 [Planctomycetota bacterium]|nr:hypothetical protein [Planctomycetota bacterium]
MSIVRWILVVVVVLAVMVVGSLTASPDGWQLALRWAAEREAQWQAIPECPVLQGEVAPGSSFAGYIEANRLAGDFRAHEARLRELAEAEGEAAVPTAADRQVLADLEPAVQVLRDAAHRQGPRAAEGSSLDFLDIFGPIDALLLAARDRNRRGDAAGAVCCLLDAVACGTDLTSSELPLTQAIGALLVERAACAFDDALLGAADAALLARVDTALAQADAALHVEAHLLSRCALHLVRMLRDNEQVTAWDLGMASPLQAWRHGFSVRRSGMARVADLVDLVQRFESATPAFETWPARKPRLEAAVAEDRANNADLHDALLTNSVELEEQARHGLAGLRLLRLAVAFHRRESLPQLADPFGAGGLAVHEHADEASFSSAGARLERTARRRP